MARKKHDTSFLNLFDGESLDDWKMAGKGKFTILQGENVLQTEGGMGLLWYYKRKFEDFTLELESGHPVGKITREYLSDFQIQEMTLMLLSTRDTR